MKPHVDEYLPFLQVVLGEPPSPDAVLRVASNHAPSQGTAEGSWAEIAAASIPEAAEYLAANVTRGDVYASWAWFSPSCPKRKDGVLARRWVSVEVDDKSMPGTTVEERRRQSYALASCLPCPTIIVASGGGYHVHIHLPEGWRVEDFSDPADGVERLELVGRALRLYVEDRAAEVVGARVALDHVHGAERVWRVPPSWNAKAGDGRRELTADRGVWRPVGLRSPGRIEGLSGISAADLSFVTPFIQAAEEERDRGGKSDAVVLLEDVSLGGHSLPETSSTTFQGVQVRFSPALLPPALQREWPLDSSDQSDHDFQVAAALAEAGWAPAVAIQAIRQRRARLADAQDRRKGGRDDYVRTTVANAYARAATPTPTPESRPFVPFPVDLLPEPVAEFVRVGSAAMTCAPEAIVLPLLTALGAAIGNSRRIQLKRSWSEPGLLWCCVVMGSGKTAGVGGYFPHFPR